MTFDQSEKSGSPRVLLFLMALTLAVPLGVLTFAGAPAFADDDDDEQEENSPTPMRVALTTPADTSVVAAIKSECGSCHIPYPAKLLPAASWQKIMGNLGDHFGTDASIDDAALTAQLTNFLVKNGGDPNRITTVNGAAAPLRITETRWFVREHDELRASVWKRPSIKSAANCGACHQGAAEGNFNERNIRIPKQ